MIEKFLLSITSIPTSDVFADNGELWCRYRDVQPAIDAAVEQATRQFRGRATPVAEEQVAAKPQRRTADGTRFAWMIEFTGDDRRPMWLALDGKDIWTCDANKARQWDRKEDVERALRCFSKTSKPPHIERAFVSEHGFLPRNYCPHCHGDGGRMIGCGSGLGSSGEGSSQWLPCNYCEPDLNTALVPGNDTVACRGDQLPTLDKIRQLVSHVDAIRTKPEPDEPESPGLRHLTNAELTERVRRLEQWLTEDTVASKIANLHNAIKTDAEAGR